MPLNPFAKSYEHRRAEHWTRSRATRTTLVTRCRAIEPRCARLLLAAHGYSQLLDAARIARCHAGGPRYSRLLASLGWAKHVALVSRGGLRLHATAHGFSWLLVSARRLASTRPQFAQPDKPIANVSLRVAGLRLVRIFCARLFGNALPGLMCALV